MTSARAVWACAVAAALFAAACSDDVSQTDPLDIPDDTDTNTSGPEPTTGPEPATTSGPDPTSSTGDDTTGGPDTGGIDVDPPYSGVPNYTWVNAGQAASSENYRMVFVLGQPSPAQNTQSSEQYRLEGGVVGANGTP